MKKTLLTGLLTLLCSLATAQTPEAYLNKATELGKQLSEAFAANDNASAERAQFALIRLHDAQPDSVRTQYAFLAPGNYYNMACIYSLQNKRKAAVRAFVTACEKGYDDYRHVKSDTDLDNIRTDKTFQRLHEAMRATSDYLHILQNAPGYAPCGQTDTLPRFSYAAPNDRDLVRVREYFKLDSVAGAGDELSKIQRILTHIHNTIRHDGSHGNPKPMNAIAMAEACKDGSRGLNCRGLATVLNECYLAMGIPSRFVTCIPKVFINDCHVINAVYSSTLDKWVWVDPTHNAWVMDENGVMLSIAEVRERLRDARELVLNETANWNNRRKTLKEQYLDSYMAKNLYYMTCADRMRFGPESPADGLRPHYTALIPVGYDSEFLHQQARSVTSDEAWFWQSPYAK